MQPLNDKRGRKLSPIESRMACLHAAHAGTTQVTSVLHLQGSLDARALHSAAKRVFARFPLLRSAIAGEAGALRFCEHADFSRIECGFHPRRDGGHWRELALAELNRPLDQERSLWRFHLLTSPESGRHELLLTRAHAISDGASTAEMLNAWLRELPQAQATPGLPASMNPLPTEPAGIPAAGCHWFEWDHARSEHLERLARESDLSVHSLLAATFLKACHGAGLGGHFDLGTAVSERDRSDRENPAEGCRITVVITPSLDSGLPLAALASDYRHRLRHSLSSVAATGRVSEPSGSGVGITDLGRIRIHSPSPALRVTGFRSSVTRRSGQPAFTLHASRMDGRTSLALTFTQTATRQRQAEAIADQLWEQL